MKSALTVLAVLSAAYTGNATAISCASGSPGIDITTLIGSNVCTESTGTGIQTYSNFGLTFSSDFISVMVGILNTSLGAGGYSTLDFAVATNPAVQLNHGAFVDITFKDTTSGFPLDTVSLENIDGKGVIVYEDLCTGPWSGNACAGSVLAHLVGLPGKPVWSTFVPQDTVYVQKFIQYADASITTFSNGIGSDTPEPWNLFLIGGGLLSLAATKRIWNIRR